MKMVGLSILIMVAGVIADTAWHNKHGFPAHHGIPESHYIMLIGAIVGAAAAFRLIRKREAALNKRWFHVQLIVAAVSIAGWLLDNLIYHTRDIYDGGIFQDIFHMMESYGALIYFALSLVVSLLIISSNRRRRSL